MLIDIKQKLIGGITKLYGKGEIMTVSDEHSISTFDHASQFCDLLRLYTDIRKPNFLVLLFVRQNVKDYIITKRQPVHSKARTLDPAK